MLRERLYYLDSYCKNFNTRVNKESLDSDGNFYAVLENTAFYPTGGGQPYDTGTLNGIQVLNVEEIDGEIRHTLAESLGTAAEVTGIIDWARRFDHMQQHAGQHILSAAFVELYGFLTISFHLGKESLTIDLDVEDVSLEQLQAVEKLANDIILENRMIETKWVTEDELEQYSLRKQLAVTGEIRLVIIPDFDYNGCGGTHPSSTGQVLGIKVMATEKHRGMVRVHFVCGGRILQQLHQKNYVVSETSKLLSAPEEGVIGATQRLLDANLALVKSLNEKEEQLLTFEVKDLLQTNNHGIVKAVYTGRTVQHLQKMARLLVTEAKDTVVLLVAENEDRLQFVAARGASAEKSMKLVSAAALPLIDGKGGGSDAFVQGGGQRSMAGTELLRIMEESLV
ncbi:alanyl-tRNA editing protein [Sporosarcina sp. Marseille-Q4063]|uniref:alanyl-tRNA editing protein n=1 Tax=Sporosarcina sp. Marseille-Q4063 TaxID=2810514 RepID=UPI001BAEAD25|nr:DHHA1 domain-containing protein [Sporosarcina sp. Marseille-Q4063]QUW20788.1 alanyl-tRNA editing protein [Sporosarcina sp. Marseille-Q4063]